MDGEVVVSDEVAKETTSFDAVLESAIRGDQACFGELWRELNPRLERFLYAQGAMGDPPASDVASETWLQVVRDLPSFKGDFADFRSWLYQIARNRMVDAARARARRPQSSMDIAELDPMASLEDVAVGVANRTELREIIAKIQALPTAQCEVLMLRIVADLTVEETAAALKKKPNAVRVLTHRALTALRQELGVGEE